MWHLSTQVNPAATLAHLNLILGSVVVDSSRSGPEDFATGARLKQPLYVCIGQRFGWEIYFPLLSELNRF